MSDGWGTELDDLAWSKANFYPARIKNFNAFVLERGSAPRLNWSPATCGMGQVVPGRYVHSTLELGSWRWSCSWFFAYEFWWEWANAGTSPSTGQLSAWEMQKGLDLSTGQLSRWIRHGIFHSRCRFGCMRCALSGKFKIRGFHDGKAAWSCMFSLHRFFLIIDEIPPHLERYRATSHQESWTHLSVPARSHGDAICYVNTSSLNSPDNAN